MAKSSKSKSNGKSWTQGLQAEDIRDAFQEATIDAYGDYEQHTSLLTALEDNLAFPFQAKVLGETVGIVGLKWPERDEFGLDLVCERNGEQHRIEARSVELQKPFPEGHLTLAAYLDWKSRF